MKEIRMAIIGAGVWGETHAAIFREHPFAAPVAICDMNVQKAEALAEKYGVGRVFGSVDELLGWGEFDAVSIVTPDHLHGDIAVACADAGKHMLIEKPLATSREDVMRILEAVKKNRVRAMVDLHNRWSPPFAAAHDAVQRGELGTLRSAYFRLNDIKWVATDMLPWAASSSIMWFLGSHSFDTLQWVFGDKARRVYTVSNRGVLDALGVPTEDVFLTTIEFERGGIAQMENGWITPNANPCVNDIKFTILGDRGMISVDASNHNMIQKYTDTEVVVPDVIVQNKIFGKPKGFAFESIRSFVDCLLTGEEFPVTLRESAYGVLAILAIMDSARPRTPVEIDYGPLQTDVYGAAK